MIITELGFITRENINKSAFPRLKVAKLWERKLCVSVETYEEVELPVKADEGLQQSPLKACVISI